MKVTAALLFCIVCLLLAPVYASSRDPFTVAWESQVIRPSPSGEARLGLIFRAPEGHFLYRDKADVVLDPSSLVSIRAIDWPKGQIKIDPFFKKKMEVWEGEHVAAVTFEIPLKVSVFHVEGILVYQGCSSTFCYREQKVPFRLAVERSPETGIGDGHDRAATDSTSPRFGSLLSSSDFGVVRSHGALWAMLIAFVGGVLTDLTPCVLPLLPLTLGFLGLRKGGSLSHHLRLAAGLVIGMALMFSALGLVAVGAGRTLGFLFQNLYFLIVLSLFFLAMALAMWGVIPLQAPNFLRQRAATWGGPGAVGAVGVGLGFGIVAAPCVGPVLGPLLLYVAKEQDFLFGGLFLFLYALGMGSLFFLIAVTGSEILDRLKSARLLLGIKWGIGLLLLLPALYYGNIVREQLFPRAAPSPPWEEGPPPASSLMWREAEGEGGAPAENYVKWFSTLADGETDARAARKPMVVDFYATWCLPCIELNRKVFSHPRVVERLGSFVTVRIDCTTETDSCREAVKRFDVAGWPTVVFIDKAGKVRSDLALVGRVPSVEEFMSILVAVHSSP